MILFFNVNFQEFFNFYMKVIRISLGFKKKKVMRISNN